MARAPGEIPERFRDKIFLLYLYVTLSPFIPGDEPVTIKVAVTGVYIGALLILLGIAKWLQSNIDNIWQLVEPWIELAVNNAEPVAVVIAGSPGFIGAGIFTISSITAYLLLKRELEELGDE